MSYIYDIPVRLTGTQIDALEKFFLNLTCKVCLRDGKINLESNLIQFTRENELDALTVRKALASLLEAFSIYGDVQ